MSRLPLVALVFTLFGYTQIRVDERPGAPHLRFTTGYVVPVHLNSDGYAGIEFERLRAALESAMSSWAVDGSTFRFERDPAGVDGDTPAIDGRNIVRFEANRLPPEVDPRSVLAFTSPVSAVCNGVLIEVDITFNAVGAVWSTADGVDAADVETVALHELGHFLGLDHSDDNRAVMFPSIVERVRRDLRADDLAGVRAIYGPGIGVRCERNGDCVRSEVCALLLTSDQQAQARCGPPLGGGEAGDRCRSAAGPCDNGCQNGLCLNDDSCSVLCVADNDCPNGWICVDQDFGEGVVNGLCVDLDGCEEGPEQCARAQACVVGPHPSDPEQLIQFCVDSGPRAIGTACVQHAQCAGGICSEGTCAQMCPRAGCPDGFECADRPLAIDAARTVPVALCVAQAPTIDCSSDAMCPAPLVCGAVEVEGERVARCVLGSGDAAGAICFSDDRCRSGQCVEGRCAAFCTEGADCPEGWRCTGRSILVADRSICAPTVDAPPPDAGLGADAALDPEADAALEVRDAATEGPDSAAPAADAGARRSDPDGGVVVIRRSGASSGGCSQGGNGPSAPRGPLSLLVLAGGLVAIRRRRAAE